MAEQHLKDCTKCKARVNVDDYEQGKIDREIQNLNMATYDARETLKMHVWDLGLKYKSVLENRRYSEFIKKKSELAVEYIFEGVEHIIRGVSHSDLKPHV